MGTKALLLFAVSLLLNAVLILWTFTSSETTEVYKVVHLQNRQLGNYEGENINLLALSK